MVLRHTLMSAKGGLGLGPGHMLAPVGKIIDHVKQVAQGIFELCKIHFFDKVICCLHSSLLYIFISVAELLVDDLP